MKTIISMATAAVGIGLLGMWGASAGPANGVAIEKAIITLQDTQQVRVRRPRRYVRPAYSYRPGYADQPSYPYQPGYSYQQSMSSPYYWTPWGLQPNYQPWFRLGPVWCC
jgi:hypothetical protein